MEKILRKRKKRMLMTMRKMLTSRVKKKRRVENRNLLEKDGTLLFEFLSHYLCIFPSNS